jgi:hypothetical protein
MATVRMRAKGEEGGGRRENEEARGIVTWQDARTMVRRGEEEGGEGDGSEIPNRGRKAGQRLTTSK